MTMAYRVLADDMPAAEDSGLASSLKKQLGSMRVTLAVGAFCGLGLLAVVVPPSSTSSNVGVSNLRATLVGNDLASSETPSWFRHCEQNDVYCDMRRNIRDEINMEARWAYAKIMSYPQEQLDLYLNFFAGMKKHIDKIQATRDEACLNFLSWDNAKARWEKMGLKIEKTGRSVANFADSIAVAFKPAEDSVHKNFAQCSWNKGEPGWGAEMSKVELAIKGGSATISQKPRTDPNDKKKFIWTQAKGRGCNLDKVAMALNVDRSLVTDSMGSAFDAQFMKNKGETDAERALPSWRQRLLPGTLRWDSSFMNDNFGPFCYGDGRDWSAEKPDVKHFFYDHDVHGYSIWGRNLTKGSPSDRMLDVGMPWIGGASGSLIDFYLAARDLGYKGKELGDLMLVHMSALVAGAHHSLGELLIAATEADREGGHMSFEKDGEKDFSYFGSPKFGKLLDIMNSPDDEWNREREELAAEGGLPALYQGALDEFFDRSGLVGFGKTRGASKAERFQKHYPSDPALEKCLKLPGVTVFKNGMFEHGGPKRALAEWSLESLDDFSRGIPAEQFVLGVTGRPTMKAKLAVYTSAAFSAVAGSDGKVSKSAFNNRVAEGANDALANLLNPLSSRISHHLWGDSDDAKTEADFTAAVQATVDDEVRSVFNCAASENRMKTDTLDALYGMAWRA